MNAPTHLTSQTLTALLDAGERQRIVKKLEAHRYDLSILTAEERAFLSQP